MIPHLFRIFFCKREGLTARVSDSTIRDGSDHFTITIVTEL